MNKWLSVAAIVVLGLALVIGVACGGGGGEEEEGVKEVKFGLGLPLSGVSGAVIGLPAKQGIELAAETIGEFTVAGERYRWKVIVEDNEWTSAGGVATATKFIFDDGVKFMHQSGADAGMSAQTICEESGVLLDIAGGGLETFGPDKPHTFQTAPTYVVHTPVLFQWLTTAHPEVKRVAAVNADDKLGHMVADAFTESAEYFGLEVVANEFFPWGATEFYPLATKVVAADPDLVEIYPAMGGFGDLREMGYEGLGAHPVWGGTSAGESTGWDNMQGWLVYQPNPFGEMSQELRDFCDEFENRYGTEATLGAFHRATILIILTEALKKAGTVDDVDRIIEVLETETFDTWVGPIKYGGEGIIGIGHLALWPAYVAEISDHDYNIVYEMAPEEAEALAVEVYK
jgi:branched-chain amino acid transport system substrate-binding protein